MAILDKVGLVRRVRENLLAILDGSNEVSSGFRVTSRYVIATASRSNSSNC